MQEKNIPNKLLENCVNPFSTLIGNTCLKSNTFVLLFSFTGLYVSINFLEPEFKKNCELYLLLLTSSTFNNIYTEQFLNKMCYLLSSLHILTLQKYFLFSSRNLTLKVLILNTVCK